ncbi:DUF6585 family protein [Cryptosporangium aurantiacum]
MLYPRDSPWVELTEPTRLLAAQLGLGALRESFATHGSLFKDRPNRIHRFDGGLVRHNWGKEPAAFRWNDVTTWESRVADLMRYGAYLRTDFSFTFVRSDGAKAQLEGSHARNGPAEALAYAALGHRVCGILGKAALAAALDELRAGQTLTFGRTTLTTARLRVTSAGLRYRTREIAWAQMAAPIVAKGTLTVPYAADGRAFYRCTVADIPRMTLLLNVLEARQAASERS